MLECSKLLPDADDLQQGVRFLAVTGLHELGQIECELLDKRIEQLLPCLIVQWVGDVERAVFALALNDDAVRQRDLEVRRGRRALTRGLRRTETVASQRP